MNRVFVFMTAIIGAGLFAAVGSMAGHLAGNTGVMVGGVLGGLVGVALAIRVAVWRRWITPNDFAAATLGGEIGFLLAVLIAVKTLSSPVGPVLSTLLVGIGTLAGLGMNSRR